MTVSICRSCRYEHSDCKGGKDIEKVKCDYFKEKLAINYPKRIEELKKALKQADRRYDILLKENGKLLLRADRLEAENKELKAENFQLDNEWNKLNDENSRLKAENEKLKAKIEKRVECGADCSTCEVKCRAWQNGFNAKGGNNHIVQIRHFNDYRAKMYTFNVPDGLTLKKGDYVLVETKGGTPKVAKCMTDSVRVNDEMLHMIMQGNKVVSSVIGRYDLKECDTE